RGLTSSRTRRKVVKMVSRRRDPSANDDEKPRHRVRISRPFYLGRCEVTQEQYAKVTGQKPSWFKDKPQNPVESVSCLDAVRFCNLLSEKDGLPPCYKIDGDAVTVPNRDGSGYRLPTEAEWEYACRAGSTTKYDFGDDEAKLAEHAWYT